MPEIPVFDSDGQPDDPMELDPEMLGGEVTVPLLHQVITAYEANRRTGTHSAKTRAEVAYSTKKPWPQKGTGRARHGDRGSPIWSGGGTTHGPRPKDYSRKIPKTMKRRALDEAVLSKINDGELVLIEEFSVPAPKTSMAVELLDKLELDGDRLVLLGEQDRNAYLATRNLPETTVKRLQETNARQVLNHRWLIAEMDPFRSFLKERIEALHGVDLDEVDLADANTAQEE